MPPPKKAVKARTANLHTRSAIETRKQTQRASYKTLPLRSGDDLITLIHTRRTYWKNGGKEGFDGGSVPHLAYITLSAAAWKTLLTHRTSAGHMLPPLALRLAARLRVLLQEGLENNELLSIFDLGSGYGDAMMQMVPAVPFAIATGVEINQYTINRAKEVWSAAMKDYRDEGSWLGQAGFYNSDMFAMPQEALAILQKADCVVS